MNKHSVIFTLALVALASLPVTAAPIDPVARARASATAFSADAGRLQRVDQLIAGLVTARRGDGNGNGASTPDEALRAYAAVVAYVILERAFPEGEPTFAWDLALAVEDIEESESKAVAMAAGRREALQALAAQRP
jgi:hypothetical protein